MEITRFFKLNNNKAKVELGGKILAWNAFIKNRKDWQQWNKYLIWDFRKGPSENSKRAEKRK